MTQVEREDEAASTSDLIRELIGTEPSTFARRFEGSPQTPDPARAGLNYFLREALTLYEIIKADGGGTARLMTEEDARAGHWPDARTANLAILMAWALLREDLVELTILAPIPYEERRPMLRQAAEERLKDGPKTRAAYHALPDLIASQRIHLGSLAQRFALESLLREAKAERSR